MGSSKTRTRDLMLNRRPSLWNRKYRPVFDEYEEDDLSSSDDSDLIQVPYKFYGHYIKRLEEDAERYKRHMKRLEEDAERYREQYIKYKELYKESKQYKEKYFQLKSSLHEHRVFENAMAGTGGAGESLCSLSSLGSILQPQQRRQSHHFDVSLNSLSLNKIDKKQINTDVETNAHKLFDFNYRSECRRAGSKPFHYDEGDANSERPKYNTSEEGGTGAEEACLEIARHSSFSSILVLDSPSAKNTNKHLGSEAIENNVQDADELKNLSAREDDSIELNNNETNLKLHSPSTNSFIISDSLPVKNENDEVNSSEQIQRDNNEPNNEEQIKCTKDGTEVYTESLSDETVVEIPRSVNSLPSIKNESSGAEGGEIFFLKLDQKDEHAVESINLSLPSEVVSQYHELDKRSVCRKMLSENLNNSSSDEANARFQWKRLQHLRGSRVRYHSQRQQLRPKRLFRRQLRLSEREALYSFHFLNDECTDVSGLATSSSADEK